MPVVIFVLNQYCIKSFEDYYAHQSGSSLNYYQDTILQKGLRFGGLLRTAVFVFKSEAKAVDKQIFLSVNAITTCENIKLHAK